MIYIKRNVEREKERERERDHRWNRNPRPQPQKFSKLVIWGSSWGRGFRFHWLIRERERETYMCMCIMCTYTCYSHTHACSCTHAPTLHIAHSLWFLYYSLYVYTHCAHTAHVRIIWCTVECIAISYMMSRVTCHVSYMIDQMSQVCNIAVELLHHDVMYVHLHM